MASPHDHVVAFPVFRNHPANILRIMLSIGVHENQDIAGSNARPRFNGGSIPDAVWMFNDLDGELIADVLGIVGGAIVYDYDFSIRIQLLEFWQNVDKSFFFIFRRKN